MMKLLFAGDFVPKNRILEYVIREDTSFVDENIIDQISDSDFAIINLEAPIVISDDNSKPIVKSGPNISCPKKTVKTIKKLGFNMVTLANNHFYDYGEIGVSNTVKALDELQIKHIGGGANLEEASKTIYEQISGKTVAFINICENEFSIAEDRKAGSHPLDLVDNYYKVIEARQTADYVIIIVHGGIEMFQLPTPMMQKRYRYLVDLGANAVINHHQHCFSGYEFYKGVPIFYGLGNFCFDKGATESSLWNEGYLLSLVFKNQDLTFSILPYTQCANSDTITLKQGSDKKNFEDRIRELNHIIADRQKLEKSFDKFILEKGAQIIGQIKYSNNKFIRKLQSLKLLPLYGNKKWELDLLNRLTCESHREVLIAILKAQNNSGV